jgi:uncharacterized membrane protein (UPF0127 family)
LAVALGLPFVIGAFVVIRDALRNDNGDAAGRAALPLVPPFMQVGFRVNNDSARRCALLAESPDAQQEGMQGKSSLLGYDAMIFAFDTDTTVSFVNHFVPIDLSIGWYDARGRLVDHTDMEACPSGEKCPTYASKEPFRYAVETSAGGLAALGLTSTGATLHVGGGC